jgi:hypothetical protein
MGDDKVSIAVLKTLLAGFKEKLGDLYREQADFLKDWPTHVSKLATLETRVSQLEQLLKDHIDTERWNWTTIISIASLILTLVVLWLELRKGG